MSLKAYISMSEKYIVNSKESIERIAGLLTQNCFQGKQHDISLMFDDRIKTISLEKSKLFEFIYNHLLFEYYKVLYEKKS